MSDSENQNNSKVPRGTQKEENQNIPDDLTKSNKTEKTEIKPKSRTSTKKESVASSKKITKSKEIEEIQKVRKNKKFSTVLSEENINFLNEFAGFNGQKLPECLNQIIDKVRKENEPIIAQIRELQGKLKT